MTAQPQRTLVTVEEYFQLEKSHLETRYEYIDGRVRMLAGGTANHSRIAVNTASILDGLLSDSPCLVYSSDMRVQLSATRYVYPDIAVSCGEQDHNQVDTLQFPRLIVEILSPSTEAYDRGQKFAYYRQCPTLQEYVLISTQRPSVELFRRGKNDLWTLHDFKPGDEVQLSSLNVSFPMNDLYEYIVFSEDESQPE